MKRAIVNAVWAGKGAARSSCNLLCVLQRPSSTVMEIRMVSIDIAKAALSSTCLPRCVHVYTRRVYSAIAH
jgi:hypothetical protein